MWDEIVRRAREPGQSIYEICMGKSLTIKLIRGVRQD